MRQIRVLTYMGEEINGNSWDEILGVLKASNYGRPADLQETMQRLAERIYTVAGEVVGIGTYEDFGHELQRVGFLKILKDEVVYEPEEQEKAGRDKPQE